MSLVVFLFWQILVVDKVMPQMAWLNAAHKVSCVLVFIVKFLKLLVSCNSDLQLCLTLFYVCSTGT